MTMNITLPLSCSIESPLISCGAIKLNSSTSKKISLKHHRMQVLKRINSDESKAKLNRTSYIGSSKSIEEVHPSIWVKKWNGLNNYIWVVLGIAISIISIFGAIFTYKYCNHKKDSHNAISIKTDNFNLNTSPTTPKSTLAHTATNTMQCEEAQLPKQHGHRGGA